MEQNIYTRQLDKLNGLFMRSLSLFGFQILCFLSIIKARTEISCDKLYKNNIRFHRCIDTFYDYVYYINLLKTHHYIEPSFSYFKVCYKDRIYKEEYINMDTVLYNTKNALTLSVLGSAYTALFVVIKSVIKTNDLEYLVLLHCRNMTRDYILARLMCSDATDGKFNIAHDTVPTKNYFLSVEYHHTRMKHTISLNLDKRYLITGNELFSPCFVLKCLNYQKEPFVFDADYKLTFLDSDINTVVLNSNQYIRLSDKTYEVVALKFSNNKND